MVRFPRRSACEVWAAAAIASAGKFARRFWLSQRDFEQSVHAVSHRVLRYERVLYIVRRRELSLHTRPGLDTRGDEVRPLPDLTLDPWQVDPAELPQTSRGVAACPSCNGATEVRCGACRGSGRNACGGCAGSGRVQGQRGPKNCPDCRGRGDVRCPGCKGGLVSCEGCRGTGRVIAWLEVQQVDIPQVVADAEEIVGRGHPGLHDAADFDAPESPARVLSDVTAPLPAAPPAFASLELDARRDRLVSERRQVLELDCFDVAWTVATGAGVISVLGARLQVDPQSATQALQRRRTRACIAAAALVIVSGVLTLVYGSRHAWFGSHGAQGTLLILGVLLGSITLFTSLEANLGVQVRRRRRIRLGLGGMLVTGLAFAVVYLGTGPRLESIQRHAQAGALAEARLEADAFVATEGAPAEAHAVLDDLQWQEIEAASALAAKASIASRRWYGEAKAGAAAELIEAHALAALERLETRGSVASVDDVLRVVSWLPADTRRKLDARAALTNVARCAGADPAPCLEARLAAARARGVDEGALAPHLRAATATLQGRIDRTLQTTPQDDPRTRRDKVALARSTALLLRAGTGVESRPSLAALDALLAQAERDKTAADERAARSAKLAAERQAQAQAAAARRAEHAARAARSSQVIKERIIAESIDDYSGSCPCPYNTARNGSSCGGRSAYSRAGGASPLCYASDISDAMVEEYKQRNQL